MDIGFCLWHRHAQLPSTSSIVLFISIREQTHTLGFFQLFSRKQIPLGIHNLLIAAAFHSERIRR
jgi:hypothetical protein